MILSQEEINQGRGYIYALDLEEFNKWLNKNIPEPFISNIDKELFISYFNLAVTDREYLNILLNKLDYHLNFIQWHMDYSKNCNKYQHNWKKEWAINTNINYGIVLLSVLVLCLFVALIVVSI